MPSPTLSGFTHAAGTPFRETGDAGEFDDLTAGEQAAIVKMIDEHLTEKMYDGTMQRVRKIRVSDVQALSVLMSAIPEAVEACNAGKNLKITLESLRQALSAEAATDEEPLDWRQQPLKAVSGHVGASRVTWESILFCKIPGRDDDIFVVTEHPEAVRALQAEATKVYSASKESIVAALKNWARDAGEHQLAATAKSAANGTVIDARRAWREIVTFAFKRARKTSATPRPKPTGGPKPKKKPTPPSAGSVATAHAALALATENGDTIQGILDEVSTISPEEQCKALQRRERLAELVRRRKYRGRTANSWRQDPNKVAPKHKGLYRQYVRAEQRVLELDEAAAENPDLKETGLWKKMRAEAVGEMSEADMLARKGAAYMDHLAQKLFERDHVVEYAGSEETAKLFEKWGSEYEAKAKKDAEKATQSAELTTALRQLQRGRGGGAAHGHGQQSGYKRKRQQEQQRQQRANAAEERLGKKQRGNGRQSPGAPGWKGCYGKLASGGVCGGAHREKEHDEAKHGKLAAK